MNIAVPVDETTSFHDNLIYGFHLRAPDPANSDWRSELILDIDHIVEWVCGLDGRAAFRVAPATLSFRDATDLSIRIDYGHGEYPMALNELSIATIECDPAPGQRTPGQQRRWRIVLNLPKGGEIAFAASGIGLVLRTEPILCSEQRLSPRGRPHLAAVG